MSDWQPIAAKLVDEWGEGYVRFPGDELPEDWFKRMLALLREIASAHVEAQAEYIGEQLSAFERFVTKAEAEEAAAGKLEP